MKDFFVMTRRERRGTIVVLVLIALILLTTVAARSFKTEVPQEAVNAGLEQFESEIDSVRFFEKNEAPTKKHHEAKGKSKKKKQSPRPSKSPQEPRHMDPVPQF